MSRRSKRGYGSSSFQANVFDLYESSQSILSISSVHPSIFHSLSDWKGMNGLRVTANPLHSNQLYAKEDNDPLDSGELGVLMCFHGAASWSIELPSCAIDMMLRSASLNRCLSRDSVADCRCCSTWEINGGGDYSC